MKRMGVFFITCLTYFTLLASTFLFAQYRFQLERETVNGFRFSIILPDTTFDQNRWLQDLITHSLVAENEKIVLNPVLVIPFLPLTKNSHLRLLHTESTTLSVDSVLIPQEASDSSDRANYAPQSSFIKVNMNRIAWEYSPISIDKTMKSQNAPFRIDKILFFPIYSDPRTKKVKLCTKVRGELLYDLSSPLCNHSMEQSGWQLDVLRPNVANQKLFTQLVQEKKGTTFKKVNFSYELKPVCNIVISRQGWFALSYSQLKEAGVPVDQIDARTISLRYRGQEIPIYFPGDGNGRFDPGEKIEFWAESNKNVDFPEAKELYLDPYCLPSIYQLCWGERDGKRYGVAQSYGVPNGGNIEINIKGSRFFHVEKDVVFDRLGWATAGKIFDHWFMTGPIAKDEMRTVDIPIPIEALSTADSIYLRICLFGKTLSSHNVDIFLSKQYIGSIHWYGVEYKIQMFRISQPQFFSEEEPPSLTIVNHSSNQMDFILLDWLDISSSSILTASGDQIQFRSTTSVPGTVVGHELQDFSQPNIRVFKLNQYRILTPTATEYVDSLGHHSYQTVFYDKQASSQDTYLAVTDAASLTPDTLFLYQPEIDLRSPGNQADMIIIAASEFMQSPFLEDFVRHKNKFLKTILVDFHDVVQQFNFGIPGPVAIKKFLQYTQRFWGKPAPRFVLLVGTGENRRRDPFRPPHNYVPTAYFQTYKFGAAASDAWLVAFDPSHPLPQLAIGRWPVENEEQLSAVVNKTIHYESQGSTGAWQNRMLFLAGSGTYFKTQIDEILEHIVPKDYFISRLHTTPPSDSFWGNTDSLLVRLNEGVSYVNFRGHGGGAVWGDNQLFQFDDVDRLANRLLPFITSMTCFTGAFDGKACLGKSLLLEPERGAIGMMGASGVGWVWNDYYLLKEILAQMIADPRAPVGMLILRGKWNYDLKYKTAQVASNLFQYNLLGDPSISIPFPAERMVFSVSKNMVLPGEIVSITPLEKVALQDVTLFLQDEEGHVYVREEHGSMAGGESIAFKIPEHLESGIYWLKIYAVDLAKKIARHGAEPISINQVYFKQISQIPCYPLPEDSITISVELGTSLKTSKDVFWVFLQDDLDSVKMVPASNDKELYQVRVHWNQFSKKAVPFYISVSNPPHYYQSSLQTLHRYEHPDLCFDTTGVKIVSHQDSVWLSAKVLNRSYFQSDSIKINLQLSGGSLPAPYLASTWVAIKPYQQKEVQIPISVPIGDYDFRLTIDPDNTISDINAANNNTEDSIFVNQMPVLMNPVSSTTLSGDFRKRLQYQITCPPAIGSYIFSLNFEDSVNVDQPGLRLFSMPGFWQAVSLGFSDEELNKDLEVYLSFSIDSTAQARLKQNENAGIYHFYPTPARWGRLVQAFWNGDKLVCRLRTLGKFAWLESMDHNPPEIAFLPGSSHTPYGGWAEPGQTIFLQVRDDNGPHPDLGLYKIYLNSQLLSSDKIQLSGSFRENSLVLQFRLPVSDSQNRIQLVACDYSGNLARSDLFNFNVSQNLELRYLGNHPNPFRTNTIFCFELTQSVDDFTLGIYTASGKLVRTFTHEDYSLDLTSAGYHEIEWDGTDNYGDEVANGVYFFRIVAKKQGKTIRKLGKIARIQ